MPQEPLENGLATALVEAWRTFQLRLRCAVNAYRTAMQCKGRPGQRPREVAKEQIRIFLETAEREARALGSERKHEYYHKEF